MTTKLFLSLINSCANPMPAPENAIQIHQIHSVGITNEERNRKCYAVLDNGMYIENAMEIELHRNDSIGIEILEGGEKIKVYTYYANGEIRTMNEQFRHFPLRYFLEPLPIKLDPNDFW